MPMKSPPHPGDLIGTEVVEALGLNVSQAAQILNVRRATLSDLLLTWQGQAHAGNGPSHRKGILAFDVAKTRERSRDICVERYVPA